MSLLQEQIEASSPGSSIWLSASAGTGKTYVLVNRFLRLILDGNDPVRIICITYTKAAAAEMQKRIIENIAELILLDEIELKNKLEKLYMQKFDLKSLAKTKLKMANILDFPEQLKIQTIHSFCQSILKSFPLEANIPPFFNVIDDIVRREMIDNIWNRLIVIDNKPEIKENLTNLLARFPLFSIKTLIKNLVSDKEKIFELINSKKDLPGYLQFLQEKLKIENKTIVETETEIFEETKGFLLKLADILEQGNKSQNLAFAILIRYLQTRNIDDLRLIFFTQAGEERKSLLSKNVNEVYPTLAGEIAFYREKISAIYNKISTIRLYDITKSVLVLFNAFHSDFENLKKNKYLLDYEDLIQKTAELLDRKNSHSQWILYKLDGGIDHILLDEAQDTNPHQWKVIHSIVDEFFSGSGETKKNDRSLFVVGDEKQSIYSFQGADVNIFNDKRNYFQNVKNENTSVNFEFINLNRSFRSSRAVLDVVNKVIQNEKIKNAVTRQKILPEHQLDRNKAFGYFELNLLVGSNDIKKQNTREQISWRLPREYEIEEELKNKEILANQVADKIADILSRDYALGVSGRRPIASDIMVLLKKRDELADQIIKKLQSRNIAVSGIDRLKLNKNLAIKDILSLAKFILLENDDLNLACLLKSPIFEVTEEELFDICWNRGEISVYQSLVEKNKIGILEKIKKFKDELNADSVFEFFFKAIEVYNLREKFISYFDTQINDVLDEFLSITKSYEDNNNASLQQFVNWFEKNNVEIKRNLNNNSGEVKIITVHGAKGLEAPIVIIPDTTSLMKNEIQYGWTDDGIFLCPVLAEYRNDIFSVIANEKKQKEDDEYYRLLYVALTRARDELYIFGYNHSKIKEGNWHDMILTEIESISEKHPDKLIYTQKEYLENKVPGKVNNSSDKKIKLNFTKYKDEDVNVILPSELSFTAPNYSLSIDNNDFTRGLAAHKLLELLPGVNKAKRSDVAKIILKNFEGLSVDKKLEIQDEVFKVLDNNEFDFIFGASSKAEVPICGFVEGNFISGNIDRLIEHSNEIIVIDYKTNIITEADISTISEKYRMQLQAYKVLLEKIYPEKNIKPALLFTSINRLVYL